MVIQVLKFLEVTLRVDPYFGMSWSQKVKVAVAQGKCLYSSMPVLVILLCAAIVQVIR